MCDLVKVTGGRVMGYYGAQGALPLPAGNQIIVTTFERFVYICVCLLRVFV